MSETIQDELKTVAEQVSSVSFVETLRDPRFIEILRETSKKVRNSGLEHGFRSGLTEGNALWFSEIKKGNTSGMEDYDLSEEESLQKDDKFFEAIDKGVIDLIGVHFHPTCDLTPSPDDLLVLSTINNINDEKDLPREIDGIGVVNNKGDIELLLIKVLSKNLPTEIVIEDIFETFNEEVRSEVSFDSSPDRLPSHKVKEKTLAIINGTGFYRGIILNINNDQENWNEEELKKIEKFLR